MNRLRVVALCAAWAASPALAGLEEELAFSLALARAAGGCFVAVPPVP